MRTGNVFIGLFCLVVAGAGGCGTSGRSGATPFSTADLGVKRDMANPFGAPDLANQNQPEPDLTMDPVDMARGNTMAGATGEPCAANADCRPSLGGTMTAPQCIKSLNMAIWPNGYCSSPCRPSKTDAATGLNADCPSDNGTCQLVTQTAGRCVALCMDAMADCRFAEGYVCENNTPYAASCTPKGPKWCDPKMPNSCPKGMNGNNQLCISFSPDDSSGQCAEICDVFKQNCTPPAMGQNACLANPTTGQATCINTGAGIDGDTCRYLNECLPGLACHTEKGAGVCRHYCRQGGGNDVACPNGETCTDLSANVLKSQIGICSM